MLQYSIEVRPFSELEKSDRGIDGTDVAIAVAIGGVVVGFTDDYGTAEVFLRPELDAGCSPDRLKDKMEELVRIASEVWAEAAGSGS